MEVYCNAEQTWSNLETAVIWMNQLSLKPGDLVISRYWNDITDPQRGVNKIVAIATGYGSGSSVYRVVSTKDITLIVDIITVDKLTEAVKDTTVDVSDLVHSETYVVYDKSSYRYYWVTCVAQTQGGEIQGKKTYTEFTDPVVVMTYSGLTIKLVPGKPYVETMEDYLTEAEVRNLLDTSMQDVSSRISELETTIFPVSISIIPQRTVFEKGETGHTKIDIYIERKGTRVTDGIELYMAGLGDSTLHPIGGTQIQDYEVTDETKSFTVVLEYQGQRYSKSYTFTLYSPTWLGVLPESSNAPQEPEGRVLTKDRVWTGSLENQKLYFITSSELLHVYDSNGFDYLPDYRKSEIEISGKTYNLYVKKEATTINSFTQKFIVR